MYQRMASDKVKSFAKHRILLAISSHACKAYAKHGYDLSGAVMQLTGNMSSFIVMDLQQAIRQVLKLF
jgi:hypothetical protein